MIIFYYGQDGYRLDKGVNDAMASYQSKFKSGLNLFKFDLLDNDVLGKVEDSVKTLSFFNEKKLIVLKNVFASKAGSQQLESLIKEFELDSSEPLVLLIKENLSEKELGAKNKTLFNLLCSEKNKVKTFDALSGTQLSSWIKAEANERGVGIESNAISQLIAYVGTDTWNLANEINKLSNYKKEGIINKDDIEILVKPKITNNIFELIDAIAVRNRGKAYELLYSQMASDANPGYVLTMIIYQFRNLLMVKDFSSQPSSVVAKALNIHPFVAQKSMRQAQAFDISVLKKIYNQLLAMDIGYKRGTSDLELELNKFVLNG